MDFVVDSITRYKYNPLGEHDHVVVRDPITKTSISFDTSPNRFFVRQELDFPQIEDAVNDVQAVRS
jgi:hypothetical protein